MSDWPDEEDDPRPIWEQGDPYLDENGELPDEERWHRENVQAYMQTWGVAGIVMILPLSLVLLFLSYFLGDWVWKFIWVFPVAFYVVPVLIPVIMRWRSQRPIKTLTGKTIDGARKRRVVMIGTPVVLAGVLYAAFGGFLENAASRWLAGWTIPWPF